MTQFQALILENEAILRLASFGFLLLVLMGLELIKPRRLPAVGHTSRQINNFLLLIFNIIAIRLLMPLALFEVAVYAAKNDIGLFNILSIPLFLNVILTIIIFDFLIYVQHVLTHKVNLLWRVHRVHHTDYEVDATTGIRFHPIEIILSLIYKSLAVLLIGPVAFAIIIYEVLLNAAALFTHSNIKLSSRYDKCLRMLFVTPDMHRIHHSALNVETDSNYGNILSIWDKLFNSYRSVPEAGYDKMQIGLNEFSAATSSNIMQLLKIPFFNGR